jgi:tetratricopeptide (TPR) repeat protein
MFRSILLFVLLMPIGVFAQQVNKTPEASSQFDTLRAQGYDALYNLDYDGARRRFTELARLFPDHPAGPQCIAATVWLQQLNQSWRLKASLYNNEAYSGNKERIDPKLLVEFREATRRAKALSEARLRKNPSDTEALYFLGAVEGLESAFAAGVERRFMAALRSGSRSVDRHREVLKRAPDYRDAELTIGLYNYIVGSLPIGLKLVAGTMGYRGSRKRGLETLERVARDGRWAKDIARVLLVDLYKREKRWTDAANVATELSTRYPRNYLFKLQIADALSEQIAHTSEKRMATASISAEQQRVFDILEDLLRDRSVSSTAGASDVIHYRYGETLLAAGQNERAVKEFVVVARRSSEAGLASISRLRAAHALDLAGKRREALDEYRAVLTAPDIYNSHDLAKRGLREPYKLK